MRQIKLAVIIDQPIHSGGGYHQSLNAALLTLKLKSELIDVNFFTSINENLTSLRNYGISATYIKATKFSNFIQDLKFKFRGSGLFTFLNKFFPSSTFEKILVKHNIDLVYFLSHSSLAKQLDKLNYITTIWDLSHRDDPEFPEVRWSRELELRDKDYQTILPKATAIIVESHFGKQNAIHRYGLDGDRIYVLPFLPSLMVTENFNNTQNLFIDIKEKYSLNLPYIFYPAQLWAHKNHIYILEGLKALELNYGIRIAAIFSGGDKGNRPYIEEYAKKLGLFDRIRFAGYVDNIEIPMLYKQSIALVMPSYFGPTNIPPLEAFKLDIPVLYSDKDGLKEQVLDAGLLMDLTNPDSMALHLYTLITDNKMREELILKGRNVVKDLEAFDASFVLSDICKKFYWRRICWGADYI